MSFFKQDFLEEHFFFKDHVFLTFGVVFRPGVPPCMTRVTSSRRPLLPSNSNPHTLGTSLRDTYERRPTKKKEKKKDNDNNNSTPNLVNDGLHVRLVRGIAIEQGGPLLG